MSCVFVCTLQARGIISTCIEVIGEEKTVLLALHIFNHASRVLRNSARTLVRIGASIERGG